MHAPFSFKLALICGGPSPERGISLNSARSVMDHLKGDVVDIIPLYVDCQKQFYEISPAQLYSNTPADFDFKLNQTAKKLNSESLHTLLMSVDIVFPVIHGPFGEDGDLQALLEKYEIPFVAHSSLSCQSMFRKDLAADVLRKNGFATLPQIVFSKETINRMAKIEDFFREKGGGRAIVKPSLGGSSIGVFSVNGAKEADARIEEIFERGLDCRALIEPFCEGQEFTVVIFQNVQGEPVALIPTEVEIKDHNHQIFDYRKKYLPTNQAVYHTPARFSHSIIHNIRSQAEDIFRLFKMRDFVRLDGWVMSDGTLYFTDINPISGLEQNSFLFRQASLIGMTHRQTLEYILKRACERNGLTFPTLEENEGKQSKKAVYVAFGSHNAERQVSLMSGTNVWLKLLQSKQYHPIPFFFDPENGVWQLPYSFNLHHTVEEIYANCLLDDQKEEEGQQLIEAIQLKLAVASLPRLRPHYLTLNQFLERAKTNQAFVFIAMHGGEGENGVLQKELEKYQIPFNGSNSRVSALCMDKYLTGQAIEELKDGDILSVPKKSVPFSFLSQYSTIEFENIWQEWCRDLKSERLIVKPRCDGCSAGIALLESAGDLERYCQFIQQKAPFIPPHSFPNQSEQIEMPSQLEGEYLFEAYIETDVIKIQQDRIFCVAKEGWMELTVAVLEHQGIYRALNPSITVAEGAILSLEEKFQGGTGINLTPPPPDIVSDSATKKLKKLVEKTAHALGIENYARLDLFFNRFTEKMILIEVNSLPALTPSTVIYHQGLAEEPPIYPLALLHHMITSKLDLFNPSSSSPLKNA
ncbi:MAG: hypothetical protein ACH350_00490 [Parachlamydiaceae bacterium]